MERWGRGGGIMTLTLHQGSRGEERRMQSRSYFVTTHVWGWKTKKGQILFFTGLPRSAWCLVTETWSGTRVGLGPTYIQSNWIGYWVYCRRSQVRANMSDTQMDLIFYQLWWCGVSSSSSSPQEKNVFLYSETESMNWETWGKWREECHVILTQTTIFP